jgi:hypothetical protein
MLAVTSTYNLFLCVSAVFVFVGSLLFLTLKPPKQPNEAPGAAIGVENGV